MPSDAVRLEQRLRSLSGELCAALALGLADATGLGADQDLRPVQLTQKLGLNKSLASRVVRALRENDALRALRGIPTPQGLLLIERALRKAEVSGTTLARLAAATTAYANLLGEFSGGRTDLEATLAGWIPEERERAERDARRSVFRGMTTLSGTRVGTVYNSLYLIPCPGDPDRLDTLTVAVRQDIRRLRQEARLLVLSRSGDGQPGDWRCDRRTLGGEKLDAGPRSVLLPDLCSHPIPELELASGEWKNMTIRIAQDAMDVNEFATLGFGWRTSSDYPRWAAKGGSFGHISFLTTKPAEAMTLDLFIHQGVTLAGLPFASVSREHSSSPKAGAPPPALESDARRDAPRVIDLDAHPSGLSSRDVRSCKAIAENATREAGFEPSDFRKFRARIEFPIPTEELTIWWQLPDSRR
ncbi:MAG: hypothetical protein ACJA2W_002121 [Planctomycetota bacterium]|jgi:hypothetical protein